MTSHSRMQFHVQGFLVQDRSPSLEVPIFRTSQFKIEAPVQKFLYLGLLSPRQKPQLRSSQSRIVELSAQAFPVQNRTPNLPIQDRTTCLKGSCNMVTVLQDRCPCFVHSQNLPNETIILGVSLLGLEENLLVVIQEYQVQFCNSVGNKFHLTGHLCVVYLTKIS